MREHDFMGASVFTSGSWEEASAKLDIVDCPWTLVRADGVGALQFSIALYKVGREPGFEDAHLLHLLESFGSAQGWGPPSSVVVEDGPPLLVSGTFAGASDLVRVWYLTDRRNLAFVTYTCDRADEPSELSECEAIVRTLRFHVQHGEP